MHEWQFVSANKIEEQTIRLHCCSSSCSFHDSISLLLAKTTKKPRYVRLGPSLFLFMSPRPETVNTSGAILASEGIKGKNAAKPQNGSNGNDYLHSSLRLQNRRFTFQELQVITNNFQRVLGRGGFGYVYDGFLEDGTQVAVKLRSQSSNQGVKEFLAEVNSFQRCH